MTTASTSQHHHQKDHQTKTKTKTKTATGSASATAATLTGRIKVFKTSDGSALGYIGGLTSEEGVNQIVDSSADAIVVRSAGALHSDFSGPFNLAVLNNASAPYPYLDAGFTGSPSGVANLYTDSTYFNSNK
ncbi:hypothetical protein OC835_007599 [Tilletia horrida]|nr:hypothetical protein OC835_007599 [Tilletia horrida]